MLKAIIIDDEENARIALSVLIREHVPQLQLVAEFDSLRDANLFLSRGQTDVVFLDIQMPGESGFELWKYFPNPDFNVVFTTAHSQYALRAIRLSALDYLLKPIDIDELKIVVQKLVKQTHSKSLHERLSVLESNLRDTTAISKIVLPTANALNVVRLSDILFCKSDNNYTEFVLQDKNRYLVSKTLKEYESMFPQQTFFRVHQSYLVNLQFVKRYIKGKQGSIELIDGTVLPISKDKREQLLQRLSEGD